MLKANFFLNALEKHQHIIKKVIQDINVVNAHFTDMFQQSDSYSGTIIHNWFTYYIEYKYILP